MEKLVVHEQLPGTPFHITGNEEKGYFLRLGDYRLTDYQTKNEILGDPDDPVPLNMTEIMQHFQNMLRDDQWDIIITIIAAIEHARKNHVIVTELEPS